MIVLNLSLRKNLIFESVSIIVKKTIPHQIQQLNKFSLRLSQ